MVTVEVPNIEPPTVAIASQRRLFFAFGIFPSSSNIFADFAVPIKVPIVSNMSTMEKVIISMIKVKIACPTELPINNSRKPRKHANKETSAKSFTWAPKLIWKPSNTVFPVKIPRIVTKILIKIEPVTFFL